MDTRTDPVEILARVSEQDGRQRAFDVWVDKAREAGWQVAIESTCADRPGTMCGVVEIEGLRYRVFTPICWSWRRCARVRTMTPPSGSVWGT